MVTSDRVEKGRAEIIAVDWGTSSLRAYRVAGDGAVLDALSCDQGILKIEDSAFAEALGSAIGAWRDRDPDALIIMSGMIGSRQGWHEAPYVSCPAGPDQLAGEMARFDVPHLGTIRIVPGMTCRDPTGVPDVMRGEETQVFGALAENATHDGLFVLPGTHSKWVMVEGGEIRRFSTYMTGELFGILRDHSLLGRMMVEAEPDLDAFRHGAEQVSDGPPGALMHMLFGVRTRGLFNQLSAEAAPEFLSGLLIGAEIDAATDALARDFGAPAERSVTVIGDGALATRYQEALTLKGWRGKQPGADIVARGLALIAAAAGLREGGAS